VDATSLMINYFNSVR